MVGLIARFIQKNVHDVVALWGKGRAYRWMIEGADYIHKVEKTENRVTKICTSLFSLMIYATGLHDIWERTDCQDF